MLNIFLSCLFGSIIIIANGFLFNYIIFKKKINDFKISIDSLFGFIFIGLIGLSVNFFFPINKIISSLFIIFSFIIFIIFFFKFEKKKKLLFSILFVSVTVFIFISYSNINRPDAGLYHLPYVKILNEDKIILGISNLHFRFGHISIFQYISALHVNFLFKEEFLNMPLGILPVLYFLYLFENFINEIENKNQKNILAIFLITVFSLYSFSRFSGLGNDGPANIFFFVLIVQYLRIQNINKTNSEEFYKILIISIFLIMLKPLMIFCIIVPCFIFIVNNKKLELINNIRIIFCLVFICLWVFKNILVSGCAIFPIKQTCLNNLIYSNNEIVNFASSEAEAWAKGYPNSKTKENYQTYNSNFNWISTWSKNHLKKVVEKVLPLIFLIFFMVLFSFFSKNYYRSLYKEWISNDKKLLYLLFFLFFYLAIWFLKFPLYRFGLAFLSSFIILIYVYFFVPNKKIFNETYLIIILISGFILFYYKNIDRIFFKPNKNYINAPWPAIYSLDDNQNIVNNFEKIFDEKGEFLYFYSYGRECMFLISPCSNYFHKNIKKVKKYGYSMFFFKKN